MKKKFIIALWQHETNTFSPVKTTLASFGGGIGRSKPFSGIEALREFKGTKNPIGGFIDIAIREGAEIEIPLAAKAEPSGAMTSDAYETMANMLCDSVRGGCDAILLDLHGAMVAEGFDDGEGELLRRIRKIAPDVPIGVALDFHTNLTEDMMRNCTVIVGYKTYPHTDMYETAFSAGDLIVRTLKGEIRPIMVWDTRPMITHMLRQAIKEKPMSDLIKMAVDAEKCGDVLSASVFGGFPKSDVPHVSFSSVVIGDGKTERAKALCDTILNTAWDRRKEFVYDIEPLEKSIGRAKELREFPVLLIDHGDNCGAGGPQDDMTVVKEVMKQGLTDVAVGSICDPMAVEEMIKAGIGSKVTVELGGKSNSTAINYKSVGVSVTGVVRAITDGEFIITGPMGTNTRIFMGKTVVLRTESIDFIVSERRHEPRDLGLFTSVGIVPSMKKYLLLKSRLHYRAGFDPITKHIVECAGNGVASSDFSVFPFKKLKHPIYPLDQF